jgi:anhydro-N-acetylmuramic acid kinase
MKEYKVIGLMSGTSLDGLDIAYCLFRLKNRKWEYSINKCETIKYSKNWVQKLKEAHLFSSEKLLQTHSEYGEFLGQKVLDFSMKHKLKKVDIVSSHGHTIFHNPQKGYTFQLGNGASIASVSGLPTISDFRILDVALHGEGAPLVPIGDRLLFGEYAFCLNLGGFSNISFEVNRTRLAFDICPVNTILNYLSAEKGKGYDRGGSMAKSGTINKKLLDELNELAFYKKKSPKSLGREWLEKYFLPVINSSAISTADKLATVTEHIAFQISRTVSDSRVKGNILITGGGANNSFLVSKIREKLSGHQLVLPSPVIINFKEALVFAFLGVLKMESKMNTLCSVTGATRNSSGGTVFIPY